MIGSRLSLPCASISQPWPARPPFGPLQSKRVPGVYLSYPFCAQKCTYCNFASGVFPRDLEARYLAALAAEVRAHRWQWHPETVYLGGGTPSTIDPDTLAALLEPVRGRPWSEATIEAAPGTITPEKARAWSRCGINRVSLGVQSFIETEIRRTGRKHTAQTVLDDVRLLHERCGIHNFSTIDLIAGLSGQTGATWRESLDWIRRIAPAHVSVYMLEVDEDSRLGKELLLGGVRYGAADIPADAEIAGFYEMAVELLEAVGIRRYEISNFAIPGWESHHNLQIFGSGSLTWASAPTRTRSMDACGDRILNRWSSIWRATRGKPRSRPTGTSASLSGCG